MKNFPLQKKIEVLEIEILCLDEMVFISDIFSQL